MIEAMIGGIRIRPSWRPWPIDASRPRPSMYDALHGRLTDHHRFMLKLYLEQYDAVDKALAEIDRAGDAALVERTRRWRPGRPTFDP